MNVPLSSSKTNENARRFEKLTDEIESRAKEYIARIDALGGVLRAELNIGHPGRALTVPLRRCPGAAALLAMDASAT